MMTGFMGGMMSCFIEPIRIGLQESVRRVTVRVIWDELGRPNQSIEVVQYLTDPSQAGRRRRCCSGRRRRARPARRRAHDAARRQAARGPAGAADRQPALGRSAQAMTRRARLRLHADRGDARAGDPRASSRRSCGARSARRRAARRRSEAAQERTHTVRVALMRMAREIEMAYLSDNENTAITQPAHVPDRLVARRRRRAAFSTFAHQRLRAGAAEGDTA